MIIVFNILMLIFLALLILILFRLLLGSPTIWATRHALFEILKDDSLSFEERMQVVDKLRNLY